MILVTGATGFIGRHLVAHLLSQNRRVRVLLSPKQAQRPLPWTDNLPEVAIGSILDDETLFKAASGVHVIYHLHSAQWWGRPRNLERVEVVGTRTLIAAARSARVGRIITLSHLGASPSSAYPLLRIKGMVEENVRAGGLAYTIIRSGIVFGPEDAFVNHIGMMLSLNPLFFLVPGQGEILLHPIYIDDLITAAIATLDRLDTIDQTLEIGGAEYTSFEDMLRTIMRVTGKHRFLLSVPPYLMRWSTAIYSRILPRSLMTPQWLDLLAENRTARIGNIYEYFGVQPKRFEDTLLTYLPKKRFLLSSLGYVLRRKPRED
ncbi:MAG: NAD(P)H-binding protein [Anaerolineae bacterium]|nr:NAD(P)H-binding protein [Anaerolineae bacterium]